MHHKRLAFYLLFFVMLSGWFFLKQFHKKVWGKWFPSPPNYAVPANNPSTKAGILLGKKLFFDKTLSRNNRIACATCHRPEVAFTDAPNQFSKVTEKTELVRNTPSLLNIAYSKLLLYDGGATSLESQVFAPLLHPSEMQQNLKELEIELNKKEVYKELFADAFGITQITTEYVAKAIAQYERSLITTNSRYEKFLRTELTLSDKEMRGFKIFSKHCETCHKGEQLSDFDFHNNGLDTAFTDTSQEEIYLGRYRITRKTEDLGKYKTPSLKNVALTPPYMHDGRWADLNAVIDHYSNNIKRSEYLDKKLKVLNQNGFGFTRKQKSDLMAFLQTLTDTSLNLEGLD
jgi:cytochrome c peroxidase